MEKYTLIIDYGKPTEEVFDTKEELIKRFLNFEKELEEDELDHAYLNIFITKGTKDITQEIFEEIKNGK